MNFTASSFLEDADALNCRLQTGRFFLQSYVAAPCLNVTFGAGIPPLRLENKQIERILCDLRLVYAIVVTFKPSVSHNLYASANAFATSLTCAWRYANARVRVCRSFKPTDIWVSFTRKHVFNRFVLIGAQLLILEWIYAFYLLRIYLFTYRAINSF